MPYLDVEGLKTIQKRVNSLYVRKDRIVNNQSTTATGMVLDARQGKTLGDAIKARATMKKGVVTLSAASWASVTDGYEQTVSLTGVTTSNVVVVAADPDNHRAYVECEAYCTGQGSGTLTFFATYEPEEDLAVNVLILQ
mgnify:CR=1 FL=1